MSRYNHLVTVLHVCQVFQAFQVLQVFQVALLICVNYIDHLLGRDIAKAHLPIFKITEAIRIFFEILATHLSHPL